MTGNPAYSRLPRRYFVVAMCFLAVFVCYIDRVNISVAALAMQERFGWSETTKGFVLSSFFIGYLLFQVPSGYLANRYGGKRVLGGAVVLWSIFTFLTPATAASLPLLIAVRIAMGLSEAATFPGAYSLYAHWVPARERARAIAIQMSGIPVGTVFALLTTGVIVTRFGWPSAFYVFGTAGLIWAGSWFLTVHDKPQTDPRLSPAERALLPQQRPFLLRAEPVPWKDLFSTPAVWALIINHFCTNWGLYTLMAWLPSYFKKAHRLSLESSGFYSSAPWLIMFVMLNLAAWLADYWVRRGTSLTVVRKWMQCIALLGSAAFLVLATQARTSDGALLLLCGALGTLAFAWSGFGSNHLDIAPRYADILVGITNTAGTLPGVFAVVLTGWLVDMTGGYTVSFLLIAVINTIGAVVWLAFSTARPIFSEALAAGQQGAAPANIAALPIDLRAPTSSSAE
jgi:ACS family sodium-dependent inorganic phosphate cotransporter